MNRHAQKFLFLIGMMMVCFPLHAQENHFEIDILKYGTDSFMKGKPISWYCYLVRRENSRILIDTGFRDKAFQKKWGIAQVRPVPELLNRLGVDPAGITHIFLTHAHIDHAGNIDLFPNATIYIQEQELKSLKANPFYAKKIRKIKPGRIKTFSEETEPLPGIKLLHTGGHTPGSASIEIRYQDQRFLFPGDNCYEEKACRKGRYAGYPGVILSHHDPAVFKNAKPIDESLGRIYESQT